MMSFIYADWQVDKWVNDKSSCGIFSEACLNWDNRQSWY